MEAISTWQSQLLLMVQFLGAFCLGLIMGAIAIVITGFCLFKEYTKSLSISYDRLTRGYTPVQVSPLLHKNLTEQSIAEVESGRFLNALLDFMFKEWRDTADLQRWVLKKINIELIELMETKAARKLLQAIKINDFDLGPSFPVIHGVRIVEPSSFDDSSVPDAVVLDVDLEYDGGFFLAIDVDLVFDKSAFISFRIKHLNGTARVLFGRTPCTHWAVSFLKEPILKFDIDTSFESHQLPQLGALITNQLHKVLRKKHTFPYYKLRYNPFFAFQHSSQNLFEQNVEDIQVNFQEVEVSIVACTRLMLPKKLDSDTSRVVYATLSVDAVPCTTRPLMKRSAERPIENIVSQTSDSKAFSSAEVNKPLASATNFASDLKPEPSFLPVSPNLKLHEKKVKDAKYRNKQAESTPEKTKKAKNTYDKEVRSALVKPAAPSTRTAESSSPIVSKKAVKSLPENLKNHSYIMVTRHFSATLHELCSDKSDDTPLKTVNVLSNTLNGSAPEHCGIVEGDRILEINGQRITSLSQAIAIVEAVRAKKEKFQFKVQRNRSASLKMDLQNTARIKGTPKTTSRSPYIPSHAAIDELDRHTPPPLDESQANAEQPATSNKNLKATLGKNDLINTGESSDSDTESDYSELDIDEFIDIMKLDEQHRRVELSTSSKSKPRESSINDSSSSLHGYDRTLDAAFTSSTSSETNLHSSNAQTDLNFARVTDEMPNLLFKTSAFDASIAKAYGWKNETFAFEVNKEQKYLNIRFWYSDGKKLSTRQEKLKPMLVGNIAVALCELELYCNMVTSKTFTRRYKVSAPVGNEIKLNIKDSFSRRAAFRKEYCFGDATITAKIR